MIRKERISKKKEERKPKIERWKERNQNEINRKITSMKEREEKKEKNHK